MMHRHSTRPLFFHASPVIVKHTSWDTYSAIISVTRVLPVLTIRSNADVTAKRPPQPGFKESSRCLMPARSVTFKASKSCITKHFTTRHPSPVLLPPRTHPQSIYTNNSQIGTRWYKPRHSEGSGKGSGSPTRGSRSGSPTCLGEKGSGSGGVPGRWPGHTLRW
jgi:uncharacterized membrane protein YgcG